MSESEESEAGEQQEVQSEAEAEDEQQVQSEAEEEDEQQVQSEAEEDEEVQSEAEKEDEQQQVQTKTKPVRDKPSNAVNKTAANSKSRTEEAVKREKLLVKRLTKAVSQQAKLSKKHETQKLIKEIKLCKEKSFAPARLERAEKRLEAIKTITQDDIIEHARKWDEANQNPTLVEKLAGFKGLQRALSELKMRPIRERERAERERIRRKQEELEAKKKLERLSYEFSCTMCTARFATEETRQTHMERRHGTTGSAVLDKKLGLKPKRANRAGQRERRAVAQEIEAEEKSMSIASKREEGDRLHPSWEAKRLKRAAVVGGAAAAAAGKVQEFDDDD